MNNIYIFHPALNCIFFNRENTFVLAEGWGIKYSKDEERLFLEFLQRFWIDIMGVNPKGILRESNIGEEADKLLSKGGRL